MTALTRLSMYPDPRPHLSNEERLQLFRRVWPVQLVITISYSQIGSAV